MKNEIQPFSITEVRGIVADLTTHGWKPVMIGGMALVVLGSQRVTWDFDFVIKNPRHRVSHFVDVFYKHGFTLASTISDQGKIVDVFESKDEAINFLKTNKPTSAFFIDQKKNLKIDVVFDFPFPAAKLLKEASQFQIDDQTFWIASEIHLLQLKQLAVTSRGLSRDKQDLEFLKARLKKK